MHLNSENPYDPYFDSGSFQFNDYPHTTLDERQFFPYFPIQWGGQISTPGTPPPFTPPSQGSTAGPPSTPPPSFVPQQVGAFAVDPGGIRGCLFKFTYVRLSNQQFWFYPIFVGQTSIAGYRWTGFRWVYYGISLQQIQSFTCF